MEFLPEQGHIVADEREQIMSKRPRRNHSPAFKAKVAIAAIQGDKTLAELSQQFDIHSNQITTWKSCLLEKAVGIFGDPDKGRRVPDIDLKPLHAKIGQLTLENDFLEHALNKTGLLSARK